MDSRVETNRILQQAQSGDRSAFASLVHPYRDRLESLIYLHLGQRLRQRVDVEDVLQETLIKVYLSLDTFEWQDEGSFFRWLGVIAENVIKDLARQHYAPRKGGLDREVHLTRQAKDGETDPGLLDTLPAPFVSPSRSMRRDERLVRLEKALDKLTPEHREVILLAHVGGVPINEVARRMERSRPATSMLLMRALRELRDVFGSTDSLSLPKRSLGEEREGASR